MTQTPEMVERVARAMHDPNEIAGDTAARDDLARPDWEELSEAARSRFRSYARAAIAAMREPTETMLAACESHAYDVKFGPVECWRAMVAAAL